MAESKYFKFADVFIFRFDLHVIMEPLLELKLVRAPLLQGNRILTMSITKRSKMEAVDGVPTYAMTFKDTMSFIPMALGMFPKTFGLRELCKGKRT